MLPKATNQRLLTIEVGMGGQIGHRDGGCADDAKSSSHVESDDVSIMTALSPESYVYGYSDPSFKTLVGALGTLMMITKDPVVPSAVNLSRVFESSSKVKRSMLELNTTNPSLAEC